MIKLIEWDYHFKLWVWHHLGWWILVVPVVLWLLLLGIPLLEQWRAEAEREP